MLTTLVMLAAGVAQPGTWTLHIEMTAKGATPAKQQLVYATKAECEAQREWTLGLVKASAEGVVHVKAECRPTVRK